MSSTTTLSLQQGQRVRVLILAESDERASISQRFRSLFTEIQVLSGVSEITEEEIAAEIVGWAKT